MAYEWSDLSYRERLYFNNDESLFLEKKTAFIAVSRLHTTMQVLHVKLKMMQTSEELQLIAEQLVKHDDEKHELFKKIDTF